MRKIPLLFFATLTMTLNSTGQAFNSNDLADKIIDAFQTKSFETYNKLLLDSTGYKEFLNDFLENNRVPEAQRKQFADREKMFADSATLEARKDFDRLLSKGVKLGVDWTQVKKAAFVFNEDTPENSGKKTLHGHLNFTYKHTTYVIFAIEAIQLSSGYKILSIRTILKGGVRQYVDPDLLDDEDI
jgi:hypothetical protein